MMVGMLIYLLPPAYVTAAIRTITAIGEYRMGDNDTRTDAKRLALLDAKRLALEQAGTYIESITEVKNLDISKDEIRAYTAGIVELIEHTTRTILEGETTIVQVEVTAKIDTDVVARQIDTLRKNGIAKAELLQAKDETERLRRELEAKTQELAAVKAKANVEAVATQRRQMIAHSESTELTRQAIALLALYRKKGEREDGLTNNNLTRAKALAEQAVGLQPTNLEAHLVMGFILLEMNKPQDADREFRIVLHQDPTSAYAHLGIADALKAQNDLSGAMTEYRTVLSLAKNEFLKAEGYFGLGDVLADQHNPDEAIAAYRKGLVLAPDHAGAHAKLAVALVDKDQNDEAINEAINEMKTAIRLDPSSPYGYLLLGQLLQLKGDLKGAIASARKGLAIEPDLASGHILLGDLLHETTDNEGAIAEYRHALMLDASNPQARLGLAEALEAKGDRQEAIAEYRQVLKQNPSSARAHLKLGRALEAKGDREAAITEYREAVRLSPNDAFAHELLAYALEEAGYLTAAIVEFREALRLEPSESLARHLVARHLADLSREASSSVGEPNAMIAVPDSRTLNKEVSLFFEHALHLATGFKNLERQSYYLALVAGAQAAAGNITQAFQTMARIQHKNFKARAVQDIAIEQAHSGDVPGALQTLALVRGDADWALASRAPALGAIAVALAKKGDYAGADRLLEDALKAARSLRLDRSPIDRTEALIASASAHAESGHAGASVTIFREAYEVIQRTEMMNDFAKFRLLRRLWDAEISAGYFDGAREAVESYDSGSMKELVFNQIAERQAETGDIAAAQKTLKELPVNSRYVSTVIAIAKAQAKKGNSLSAERTLTEAAERARNSNGAPLTWFQLAQLTDIAEAMVTIGNKKLAIELLTQAEASVRSDRMDELDRVLAWPHLAKMYATLGNKTEASQAFQHAVQAASKISNPDWQARAFRAIAAAQARAGDSVAAASTYRQALSAALNIPSENSRLEFIEGTIELAHEVAARAWRTGK